MTNQESGFARKLAVGLTAAFELVILTCAGFFGGRWAESLILDSKNVSVAPWLSVLGVLVGVSGGFYRLYRILVQEDK